MKLIIIRHGQAEHNIIGDYSIFDPKLTELGVRQCQDTRKKLYCFSPEIVLVSPSKRTLQTSDIIFKDYPTFVCNLLVEYQTGLPCNKTQLLYNEFTNYNFFTFIGELPKKETYNHDGRERARKVVSLIEALRSLNKNEIAIVSHGKFIMDIVYQLNFFYGLKISNIELSNAQYIDIDL